MAKTKTCVKCGTKLTKKNSVPNGMGGFRNMCREHWREYQRDLAAKRASKSKNVVKEVNAPEIETSYNVIAKTTDGMFKIGFIDKDSIDNFRKIIEHIDDEMLVVIRSENYYRKNAAIFATITAIFGAGIYLVAGLNAFGVLNLFK